ncbi:hypothetical protein [Streptomyces sp. TS71-3]|uniref:hypothetical protein n=1 Tax=Streptomyces sp. TS71-3 TaxID=2733862 RepID=UPI001B0213E3|nr:hypothetical protein [Streptomyces sp. TS71-3]GHJ38242.1 hypothetical protein Sm713_38510 [Streptomyces sp. TS71-3]
MAKNKNRKQGGRQARPPAGGQAPQQAKDAGSGMDAEAPGGSGGSGRKQQRRFGHN